MYIHSAKVAGSNKKATDEGLLVMEHSRCMSTMLFSYTVNEWDQKQYTV